MSNTENTATADITQAYAIANNSLKHLGAELTAVLGISMKFNYGKKG
jgi:hypothetical protein